jgi:hypothetical protein
MTITIIQVIAGLLGLITLLAKDYLSPEARALREQETADAKIDTDRTALVDGNVAAVEYRIDHIMRINPDRGNAGVESGRTQTGGLDPLQRLAALGISTGATPSEGGTLPSGG